MRNAFLLMVVIMLLSTQTALAQWDDCPRGETNCTGECGAFTDTNNDNICDHSQPEPAAALLAVGSQEGVDRVGYGQAPLTERYAFIPLAAALIMFYALTYALAKKGRLSLVSHRKIWNIALAATFIVTALFGTLLVLRLNYGIVLPNYLGMLYWHVEFGIAMSFVAFFHLLWHLAYYKSIFRRAKK